MNHADATRLGWRELGRLAWLLGALAAGQALATVWRVPTNEGGVPGLGLVAALAAAAVWAMPRWRAWVERRLDAGVPWGRRGNLAAACLVGVVAVVWARMQAALQDRTLWPTVHDENSIALQATMLAGGRLWTAAHPLADFFESFFILHEPVYGSMYFPGAALFFTPAMALGLPTWWVPLGLFGLAAALTFELGRRAAGGATAGVVAAAALLVCRVFEDFGTRLSSQLPTALLGLAAVLLWMRWRRDRAWWAALAVGAAAGWAAITRPADALALMLPIGVAMAWQSFRTSWRAAGGALGLLVAGAAPFLSLQVVQNVGMTGDPLEPPYVWYLEKYQPASVYASGERPASAQAAAIELPQKRDYWQWFIRPEVERDERMSPAGRLLTRTESITTAVVPGLLLAPLLAAGVLLAPWRPGWFGGDGAALRVVLAMLCCFVVAYALNPIWLYRYVAPAAPLACVLLAAGASAAANVLPRLRPVLAVLVLGGALVWLGERMRTYAGEGKEWPTLMRRVVRTLPGQVETPAVVFVRYASDPTRRDASQAEPVYNWRTIDPDDGEIVYLHDLPGRRAEALAYYAGRRAYLLDRATGELRDLGMAGSTVGP